MRFYRNDDLEQGTSEWLAWRRQMIGASDAPTIMSENPWKRPQRLLEEKLGLHAEFSGNAATREGQELEPSARRQLERMHGIPLAPTIVQSSKHAFLAASLDAVDRENSQLFEIKSGRKSYEYVERNNRVPSYYYAQLQHMLMITQLEWITFAAFRPDKPLLTLTVPRDSAYIANLEVAELAFATRLRERGHALSTAFRGRSVFF